MASPEFVDPYLDPTTGLLRNRLNARTKAELDDAEGDLAFARLIQLFWNRVARDAGWQLDWRAVHGSTNDAACRAASERRDFEPLRSMFGRIVTEATPASERDATWHAAERARVSFSTSRSRTAPSVPEPEEDR